MERPISRSATLHRVGSQLYRVSIRLISVRIIRNNWEYNEQLRAAQMTARISAMIGYYLLPLHDSSVDSPTNGKSGQGRGSRGEGARGRRGGGRRRGERGHRRSLGFCDPAIRDASDFSRLAGRARARNYATVILARQGGRCFGRGRGLRRSLFYRWGALPRRGSNGTFADPQSRLIVSGLSFPSIFADRTGCPSQPHLVRPC